MQSFYSSNLLYVHAYLKLNLKDVSMLDDALSLFNEEMSALLTKNSGKVMHTKTFQ
jgi:hypothetical protein